MPKFDYQMISYIGKMIAEELSLLVESLAFMPAEEWKTVSDRLPLPPACFIARSTLRFLHSVRENEEFNLDIIVDNSDSNYDQKTLCVALEKDVLFWRTLNEEHVQEVGATLSGDHELMGILQEIIFCRSQVDMLHTLYGRGLPLRSPNEFYETMASCIN